MNGQSLEIVKIERDAVCIFICNGENKKLDRLLNMYCKCENVMMKNVRASKDHISTMTIEDPHSEQRVTQNACLQLRVYIHGSYRAWKSLENRKGPGKAWKTERGLEKIILVLEKP